MKQNIVSKGEVELNQAEVAQAALILCQEDKKVLMAAVSNYLKKNHGYTLKKLASSIVHNEIVVRAEVEFTQGDMDKLFQPVKGEEALIGDKVKRGPNSVAFVRKNKGLFAEFIDYLKETSNGGKKPVDFDAAFEAMHHVFPDMDKRRFMQYMADKRQQKTWKYVLKVNKDKTGKVISKHLNLA